jgi:hypothetical protein
MVLQVRLTDTAPEIASLLATVCPVHELRIDGVPIDQWGELFISGGLPSAPTGNVHWSSGWNYPQNAAIGVLLVQGLIGGDNNQSRLGLAAHAEELPPRDPDEPVCVTAIEGVGPSTIVEGSELGNIGGAAVPTYVGDPIDVMAGRLVARSVNIFIDTTDCRGAGYFFNEGTIQSPQMVRGELHIALVHELAHAFYAQQVSPNQQGPDGSEKYSLALENDYRALREHGRREVEPVVPCGSVERPGEGRGCGDGPWWSYREDFEYPFDGINQVDITDRGNLVRAALHFYSARGHFFEAGRSYNWWDKHPVWGTPIQRFSGRANLSEAVERPFFDELKTSVIQVSGAEFVEPSDENFNSDASDFRVPCNPPKEWSCMIADSYRDGPRSIALDELRSFRQGLMQKTRWGRAMFDRFHEYYYSFSGEVARRMREDREMKDSVGFMIASPLVNYLRLVARAPKFDPDLVASAPGPIREFLELFFDDLHAWLRPIDVGVDLDGLTSEAVAIEVAIALRFRFRSHKERGLYLRDLVVAGRLPLTVPQTVHEGLAPTLFALGLSQDEVASILRCE